MKIKCLVVCTKTLYLCTIIKNNMNNKQFPTTLQEAHLTSVYILQDDNGVLYSSQFRPTENFKHHRTSGNDVWALACGCFIDEASHDLWLGDIVTCTIASMAAWGIVSCKKNLKIVAKAKYIWDYSLPIGNRKVENKETSNFRAIFNTYRKQATK